jgi:tetratricopeptide (TPR) repeat protein
LVLDLREQDARDQNITVNAVMRWLETHFSWLLIFDSADNLELIRDFLPTGGKGHIIITTRSQATGTLAQPLEVTELEPDDAALLLLHRARILPLEASLVDASDTDQADARAIASLSDGLPLAIDQAGAYIETLKCSLSDYKERYQQERTTLLNDRGRFPTVHLESVTTTFSLSFRNVQKTDQAAADLLRFFAFLSPEAIPIDLLLKGAPDLGKPLRRSALNPQKVDRILSTLYSYSLVRRDTATNTLYLHRLVQDVLKDEMSAGTQHQWAERTVRAVSRTFPSVEVETWHLCRQLIPQAVVCMTLIDQWHMSFPEAALLLNQSGQYLMVHAQYAEAEPLMQRALTIYEQKRGPDHPSTAISLNNLAYLYKSQGKYEQAEPLYQRAIAIDEQALGPKHPTTVTIRENYESFREYMEEKKKRNENPGS